MATIFDLAQMSDNVYNGTSSATQNVALNGPLLKGLTNWTVLDNLNTTPPGLSWSHGYFGVAYRNTVTGEIVIANRGTDNLKNLASDVGLIFHDPIAVQTDAANFAQAIASQVQGTGYTSLIETGHSLGGTEARAAIAALVDDANQVVARNKVSCVPFNSPRMSPRRFTLLLALLLSSSEVAATSTGHSQDIAELWADLHLGSELTVWNSIVPLLARSVAQEDGSWGPNHPRWKDVTNQITIDLHKDLDASAARAQIALSAMWQGQLRESLRNSDIAQLLAFFRSPRGLRYLDFQQKLQAIALKAGESLMETLGSGQFSADENVSDVASSDLRAIRGHIESLSLPATLMRSQKAMGEGMSMVEKVAVMSRGNEIDALAEQYKGDILAFDRFNHSSAIGKVTEAESKVMVGWAKADAPRAMQTIIGVENEKHKAEWRAVYARQ